MHRIYEAEHSTGAGAKKDQRIQQKLDEAALHCFFATWPFFARKPIETIQRLFTSLGC
jgi:ABC-type Zn2+ transport system substrate-binding protein/surface adhesin